MTQPAATAAQRESETDAANTWPSIQPQQATDIDAAFHRLMLALHDNRPRPLRALNSRGELEDRARQFEAIQIAYAEWFKTALEDTAQHCSLSRRTSDYAVAVLSDLASDVRGELVQAIDGVVTAA